MISPSQRPLPDNTQHSQHTNIQALGGIRTHNLSRRAAVDLRLRPRYHWDRLFCITKTCKLHLGNTIGSDPLYSARQTQQLRLHYPSSFRHSFNRTMCCDMLENHGCSVYHVNALMLHCLHDMCLSKPFKDGKSSVLFKIQNRTSQ